MSQQIDEQVRLLGIRQMEVDGDLTRRRTVRQITCVCDTSQSSREALRQQLNKIQSAWEQVNKHEGRPSLLDSDIEHCLRLWDELWSLLVTPNNKKAQEELADLIKETIKQAFHFISKSTVDASQMELVEALFSKQDTVFRLGLHALSQKLSPALDKTPRKDQSKGEAWKSKIFLKNDLHHLWLAIAVYIFLCIILWITSKQLSELVGEIAGIAAWYIVLLWLPTYFLSAVKIRRYQLTAIIWATFLLWLAYGFIWGTVYSFFLFVIPVSQLLKSPTFGSLDQSFSKYVLTMGMGLFFVFVFSHELLWLFGLAIWSAFTFVIIVSRSHYRRLDQVESVTGEAPSISLRHRILYGAYVVTIVLQTPGIAGSVFSRDSINELLVMFTGLLITFVTLVFAIQAIVPGITSWEKDSTRAGLREKKVLLQTMLSLRGFLITGLVALVLVLLSRILPITSTEFSFRVERYFDKISHIGDAIFHGFEGTASWSFSGGVVAQLLIILAVTVSIQAFAQVYYLFFAANTLMAPLKLKVASQKPIVKSPEQQCPEHLDEDQKKICYRLAEILGGATSIHGMEVMTYGVSQTEESLQGQTINIDLWEDIPNRKQMTELTQDILDRVFRNFTSVDNVRINCWTKMAKFNKARAFHIELSRHNWEQVVRKQNAELPLEYKLTELGAIYNSNVFEDAYAA